MDEKHGRTLIKEMSRIKIKKSEGFDCFAEHGWILRNIAKKLMKKNFDKKKDFLSVFTQIYII